MGLSRRWLIVLIFTALIKLFSFFPDLVEKWFSNGIYQGIALVQRSLFGWMPFSFGDIFYLAAGIWLLAKLIGLLRRIFRKELNRGYFFYFIRKLLFISLWVYIIFNLLWGMNYNRLGIAHQLSLDVKPYGKQELVEVISQIVGKLNELDSVSRINRDQLLQKKYLFGESEHCYELLSREEPIFTYKIPSVKNSLFSRAGDYLGFTGYYNPFSGEAQVNTTVPVFVQPFTTCHEIGHQLGYAKENEANFAGYLSARSSSDPAFRYSVYFDLYLYAARELYIRDSTLLVPLRESLHPAIRKDYKTLREFYRQYENPLEPILSKIYGKYLRANQQPQGILSYDEVIAWLIAYFKKMHSI
jgi:hypothetical protein